MSVDICLEIIHRIMTEVENTTGPGRATWPPPNGERTTGFLKSLFGFKPKSHNLLQTVIFQKYRYTVNKAQTLCHNCGLKTSPVIETDSAIWIPQSPKNPEKQYVKVSIAPGLDILKENEFYEET